MLLETHSSEEWCSCVIVCVETGRRVLRRLILVDAERPSHTLETQQNAARESLPGPFVILAAVSTFARARFVISRCDQAM